MRNKATLSNIDLSDPNYLLGRIKNDTGSSDGTPVNEFVYGDIHQFFAKLLNLAGITPNDIPDNELNGYQTIEALISIASKNDYVYDLSSVSSVLQVGVKIGLMKTNEFLICKAANDFTSETTIKGSDNVIISVVTTSNFKTGDCVMITKTASNIRIDRLIDAVNLDVVVSEYNYLKKATQTQENTGTSELVATTPKTNKTVFERRVNGLDSPTYLATSLQNGIYPKEHFIIVQALANVRNKGWISGIDVGGSSGALAKSGDIVSATASSSGSPVNDTAITVNLVNAMNDLNYVVKMYVQSEGSIGQDNDIGCPIFKVISTTQFIIGIHETAESTQSLKIHIEVEQL